MANVPDTTTFNLQNVSDSVYGDHSAGRSLSAAFSSAIGVFDVNYRGSNDQLYNFRNYNNDSYGLYGAGYVNGHTNQTTKVLFANGSTSNGTNLATIRRACAAAGSTTFGLIGGGATFSTLYNVVDKYTYSTDGVAAGTALGLARYEFAACGSLYRGLFSLGGDFINPYIKTYTDLYTYSSDAVAAGTTISQGRMGNGSCSNPTTGYIVSGWLGAQGILYYAGVNKYTFASDAVTNGTNVGTARMYLACSGTKTIGIMCSGQYYNGSITLNIDVTDKYGYSGDSVAAGTTLGGTARRGIGAAGNTAFGPWVGGNTGNNAGSTINQKYTYSNDGVASSNTLATAVETNNGTSPTMGGLQ